MRIPKDWIRELGLIMATEVIVEKVGSNPLGWEIKIKPVPVPDGQRRRQSEHTRASQKGS